MVRWGGYRPLSEGFLVYRWAGGPRKGTPKIGPTIQGEPGSSPRMRSRIRPAPRDLRGPNAEPVPNAALPQPNSFNWCMAHPRVQMVCV